MTYPQPHAFRCACRIIILACLAVALPAVPRAYGQGPPLPGFRSD
jgi:hypothetical protein